MSYDWWLSALELVGDYGVLTREQCMALGVHEDVPQPGFYRVPPPKRRLTDRDDLDEAMVAIWKQGDALYALWNGEPMDAFSAWAWCCRTPIDEIRYRRAERRGFTNLGAFASGSPAARAATSGELTQ